MRKLFMTYVFIGGSFLMLLGLAFLVVRNSGYQQTSGSPLPAYFHNGEGIIFDEKISPEYLPLGSFIKGKVLYVIPDAPMFKMMY